MFYKALGYVIWKLAMQQLRYRYGRQMRIALGLGVASIFAAGYLAARSGDTD